MENETLSNRIKVLREKLKELSLDGFLVPMSDKYQNEHISPHDRRIEFLSGFTGSSAFIVVLAESAAFFTDSRYTLQAAGQVPTSIYSLQDIQKKAPYSWLKETAARGAKIGFDSSLHTIKGLERWDEELTGTSIVLTALAVNPIDEIWEDRPEKSSSPIYPHEKKYSGRNSADKILEISSDLRKNKLDATVIINPASIAWLLNVRGGDIPHTPLPLSFAIIRGDGTVTWFVDKAKSSSALSAFLPPIVKIEDESSFPEALRDLGSNGYKVGIDKSEVSFHVFEVLQKHGADIEAFTNPCTLPKAIKNPTEIDGAIAAHRRDGAALVKLLAWIDKQFPGYRLSELDVVEKLESFRMEGELYRGPSFDTIAGAGPNGAIVHYKATPETDRMLDLNSFLLLDSGGQYLDGTTDVTRTIVIGKATDELCDSFTRVLKGNIALADARFPEGTSGADLDILARQHLWEAGLDYGHGTGHGVGSYLDVHEGPQAISSRNRVPLIPGMILSNEPGYYKENCYGIRIENLQLVIEMQELSRPGFKMLGFKTLTLAPIDKRAIKISLLSKKERLWLNDYHTKVREEISPLIKDNAVLKWLESATSAI